MDAIRIADLSKVYGKKAAVDHLNMTVSEGAIYGFIGQNGAGKLTTQKLICGLTPPAAGRIELFEKDYRDAGIRSQVGMLIENAGVYPGLTARENLKLYGLAIGADHLEREIGHVLELTGLKDTISLYPFRTGRGSRKAAGRRCAVGTVGTVSGTKRVETFWNPGCKMDQPFPAGERI